MYLKKILLIKTYILVLLLFFVPIVFANERSGDIENILVEHISNKLDRPHRENTFRVKFKETASDLHILSINHALGNMESEIVHRNFPPWFDGTPFEKVRYIRLDEGNIQDQMVEYYSSGFVESVEPVYIENILGWDVVGDRALPNDWNSTNHWYFDQIELPELWFRQDCQNGGEFCGGNDDVVVAVIDTGMALDAYTANFSYNGDTYTNLEFGPASEQTGVNLWQNLNPSSFVDVCEGDHGIDIEMWLENRWVGDPVDCNLPQFEKEGHPNDDQGHGTFVSGVIASAVHNNAGSVGMAHNVSMMTIKANIPFIGSFYGSAVEAGIYYAVYHGADVINMSLGGSFPSAYEDAIDYAVSQGVVVVGASGNNNNSVNYPAAFENVIAVGSVDIDGTRSPYSCYGPELDFVAPSGSSASGRRVWQETITCSATSCDSSSDFTSYSHMFKAGTSFAAPQVAGAVALIKGFDKNLNQIQIKEILIDTVDNLGNANELGYGRLNLRKLHDHLSTTNIYSAEYINSSNGHIFGRTTQAVLEGNDTIEVEAVPFVGHHFVKWSDDVLSNRRRDVNVMNNIFVEAIFDINTYSLSYSADANGSISGDSSQTVEYDSHGLEVEAVANPEYTFMQWSDGSTKNPRREKNVQSDISVTAEFISNDDLEFSQKNEGVTFKQKVLDQVDSWGIYFLNSLDSDSLVDSPSVNFTNILFEFLTQSTTGELFREEQRLRFHNPAGYHESFDVNIAPANLFWDDDLGNTYPVNGASNSDGRLYLNSGNLELKNSWGCDSNAFDFSLDDFNFFDHLSIDLFQVTQGSFCTFDLEGIAFTQYIPSGTPTGQYSLEMVLTLIPDDVVKHTVTYEGNEVGCFGSELVNYSSSNSSPSCAGYDLVSSEVVNGNCIGEFNSSTGICSDVRRDITIDVVWEGEHVAEDCSGKVVGDVCGGGVVAYIDGGSGLIAHASDSTNSLGVQWGCQGTSVGGTSVNYGTGFSNTNNIVSWHSGWSSPFSSGPNSEVCSTSNDGSVAAELCYALNTDGYTDWFLPSKNELEILYNNRVDIGGFDESGNAPTNSRYWSSSESNTHYAWRQSFATGNQFSYYKSNDHRVRCIRAF